MVWKRADGGPAALEWWRGNSLPGTSTWHLVEGRVQTESRKPEYLAGDEPVLVLDPHIPSAFYSRTHQLLPDKWHFSLLPGEHEHSNKMCRLHHMALLSCAAASGMLIFASEKWEETWPWLTLTSAFVWVCYIFIRLPLPSQLSAKMLPNPIVFSILVLLYFQLL